MIWRLMKDFKSELYETKYKKNKQITWKSIIYNHKTIFYFLEHQAFDIAPMAHHQNPILKQHSNTKDNKSASKCIQ